MADTQQPDDGTIQSVNPTTKEKVLGGIGSMIAGGVGGMSGLEKFKNTPLAQAIQRHQQQRLSEAQMNQKNYATYASILATGKNPQTGALLTPEERQHYQDMADAAWGQYEKAAGVNKQTKEAIKKQKVMVDGMMKMKGQGGDAQPQQGGAAPAQGAPAQGGMPPPPKQSGYDPQKAAVERPALQQGMDDEKQFSTWKKMQDVLKQNRIDEDAAKEKAKAEADANKDAKTRPVMGPAISVANARTAALQGKSFKDEDGNVIDLTAMPDSMGLKYVAHGSKSYYVPFSPNSKVVTVGNETYAVSPMDVAALGQGAGTDLGQHNTPSTTKTTDPTTGQTTVATRTPSTQGVQGRGMPAPPKTSTPASPSSSTPSKAPAPAPRSAASPSAPASSPAQLDENGHIPDSFKGASPIVIEGANELLDGRDLKDLKNPKAATLSAQLARQYGWEQGKFTPKEQMMLRNATSIIDQTIDSGALKVYDDTGSRFKLAQVLASGGKKDKGMIGTGINTALTGTLTDDEAKYKDLYNQTVGRIQGLSAIVRPGSKATEQAVARLIKELPNPETTKDSKEAKNQLRLIYDEINTALQKGTFESTADVKKKGMPAPPKTSGKKSIDDEIMQAIGK